MGDLEQSAFTKSPKKRKPKSYRAKAHVPDGFPHYSTSKPYHCMCLQECCQWEDGCVCKHCPCHFGVPHDPKAAARQAEIDAVSHAFDAALSAEFDER